MRESPYAALAVLALLGLGGCRPAAVAPLAVQPARPPVTENVERHTAALENGFITLEMLSRPGLAGPRPVLVNPVIDQDWLLDAGIRLVKYTAHWELLRPLQQGKPAPPPATVGKWMLAAPTAALVGRSYFEILTYNAERAIPAVVDHLRTLPTVDPDRIALAGNSTTGFTALQALARERRLVGAVVMNACGDYHTFLRDSDLALDGKQPVALDAEYEAWLQTREPILHADRLPPKPLLLMNGRQDRTVPITCAQTTAPVFRAAYRRAGVPSRFVWLALPDVAHEIPPAAITAMRRWWTRWLLRGRAPRVTPGGAPPAGNALPAPPRG